MARRKDENVEEKGEEKPTCGLVKMIREEGEPKTADVHPDNVDDMLAHGWRVEE